MRNILFTLAMLTICSAGAQAQTEKGRWTVGAQVGNLGYLGGGSDVYRSQSFSMSLSPLAGYFVARNLAIGASVPVSYFTARNSAPSNAINYKSNSVGVAPFVRYYIGSTKLRPFVSASYGYSRTWFSSTGPSPGAESKSSNNYSDYTIGGGVAYFINNTVSLDASLSYNKRLGNMSSFSPGRADLSIGFRLFFGK